MKRYIYLLFFLLSLLTFNLKAQDFLESNPKVQQRAIIPTIEIIQKDNEGYYIKLDNTIRVEISEKAYKDLQNNATLFKVYGKPFVLYLLKYKDDKGYYYYTTLEDRKGISQFNIMHIPEKKEATLKNLDIEGIIARKVYQIIRLPFNN